MCQALFWVPVLFPPGAYVLAGKVRQHGSKQKGKIIPE